MSVNKLFPFMIQDSTLDCNTTMNMGAYYTTPNTANNPTGTYAELLVFNHYGKGQWVVQLLFVIDSSNFYFRATGKSTFEGIAWCKVMGTIMQ